MSRYDWTDDPQAFWIFQWKWGEWTDPWGHAESAFVISDAAYVRVNEHVAPTEPETRDGFFDDSRRVIDSKGRRFFPSSEFGSTRPPQWVLSTPGEPQTKWRSQFDQSEWTCPVRLVDPHGNPYRHDLDNIIVGERLVDSGVAHRRFLSKANGWD